MKRTQKILSRALKKAKKIRLHKDSKLIFFSDLHKGDNSYADDFAHNMKIYNWALKNYFKNDFTYIELGDGIELWENKSFEPIYQAHQTTFELLNQFHSKNRLHLLYQISCLFSGLADFSKIVVGKK